MKERKEAKYKKEPVRLVYKGRKDGTKVIYLEFYLNGVRTYERIPDLSLLPETDEKAVRKNKATIAKAEKICRQRLKSIQQGTKAEQEEMLTREVKELQKKPLTLLEWLDDYKNLQKQRGVRDVQGIGSLKRYITLFQNKGDDIQLNAIDKRYCLDFIDYLKSGYRKEDGTLLSLKSAFNIFGELRTALNMAVRAGLIESNPVNMLDTSDRIHPKEATREYLTIEEVKRLIAAPCDCPIVKQAFLFACNCGLRKGDVLNLKWKDITADGDTWRVATRMLKTQRLVYIPLPKQALRWLPPRPNDNAEEQCVFDGLTVSLIAQHLKPWAKEAGITGKDVTFHVARHTYATMLLTLGADLYTVSKLLGHSSVRHTQRYARIIDSVRDNAVKKIDDLIP